MLEHCHERNCKLWERLRRAPDSSPEGALIKTKGALPNVVLTYDVKRKIWESQQTAKVFVYTINKWIQVEEGFRFDLSSIPRCFWRIIAPFELGTVAPLVHDILYQTSGKHEGLNVTRKEADQIFAELMEREGVSWWRRALAYRALRLFGSRW